MFFFYYFLVQFTPSRLKCGIFGSTAIDAVEPIQIALYFLSFQVPEIKLKNSIFFLSYLHRK